MKDESVLAAIAGSHFFVPEREYGLCCVQLFSIVDILDKAVWGTAGLDWDC